MNNILTEDQFFESLNAMRIKLWAVIEGHFGPNSTDFEKLHSNVFIAGMGLTSVLSKIAVSYATQAAKAKDTDLEEELYTVVALFDEQLKNNISEDLDLLKQELSKKMSH
jgi:hypothetical protein